VDEETKEHDVSAPKLVRKILATEPGFYPDITPVEYFAEICPDPALTNSGIKTLLTKTPADFAHAHPAITPDAPEAASTAAKRLGDIGHQLALGKGRGIAIGEFDSWRTKDAKQFREWAESSGKTPILRAKYDDAVEMALIMKAKIAETLKWIGAMDGLIEPAGGWKYETEVVFVWQEDTPSGKIWCRGMADIWCPDLMVIADPKFSERLYPGTLERHILSMGWDIQNHWYSRGIETLVPGARGRLSFVNLLVSPNPPFRSRAIQIEEAWRYSAQLEVERAIGMFAAHLKNGVWPGFPAGVETLNAPPWVITQRMDATAFGNDPIGLGGEEEEIDDAA
jgi:hypothetical protein